MKSVLSVLALGLAVSVAGCAAIDPGAATQSLLSGPQLGLQEGDIAWPDAKWWERYGDTQLNQLMEEALRGSPSLAIAQARLDMANASARSARAVRLPQLNAGYQHTRQRFSENYIYPPPYGGSMLTDASLRLNASFDLDLWGKNRALHMAALTRAQASQADAQAARNALVGAVAQSYFNLQNALAQHEVIGRIVEQLGNVLDVTRQRVAAGLDTRVEQEQAASALSSAKVQLSQADTNAELLRHQLAALLGAGPERGKTIVRVALGQAPTGVPERLPLSLLGRRPDVVAARLQAQASASDVSAAKAAFYPDINLAAFAGFLSLGLDNLLQGSSRTYGVGPAISLPLFNGGQLNAKLSGKRAERELAIAQYNQTLLQAVREVADTTTRIRALQSERSDQQDSYRAIASAYEIAVQRYKSGLGNFVQVLLAQNEVQKQAILNTDLQARAYNLDAELATVLGGGYQEAEAASAPADAGPSGSAAASLTE